MKNPARKVAAVTMLTLVGGAVVSTYQYASARSASPTAVATTTDSTLLDIDRLIRDTQRQMVNTPTSSGLGLLARLQLSRGRITGDAASYAGAQNAVGRALAIAPRDPDARTIDAEVRYTNHDFAGALATTTVIVREDPKQMAALATRGDAARELGNYFLAESVLSELERGAPREPSVLVRRARLAFLEGDSQVAEELAQRAERQALRSGLLGPTLAFYPAFRGQLSFDAGRYTDAVKHFEHALLLAPGDRVATFGLARAEASRGKTERSVKILRALTDRFPDPAALTLLGDVLSVSGDNKGADESYALVDAIAGLATANRQIYNRELALFYANHDRRLADAVSLARAEIVDRKDVYGYDALAWTEFKAGNLQSAAAAADKALALGTPDAALSYHAGMIAAARGENVRARALLSRSMTLSPNFDVLQAPLARIALDGLPS